MEYFAAKRLLREMKRGNYSDVLHQAVTFETYVFLAEMLPEDIDLTDFCEIGIANLGLSFVQEFRPYLVSPLAQSVGSGDDTRASILSA